MLYTYIMNLDELKKNHKTAFLSEMYEKLLKEEAEILEMAKDASMREMAEADLKNLVEQKKSIESQIQAILDSEKEEVEIPNELILEVRAGAGGEEAALFAEKLRSVEHRAGAE